MGIDVNVARFLLACKTAGISFQRTLTFGRQHMLMTPALLRQVLEEFSLVPDTPVLAELETSCGKYSEAFLRYLGAHEIDSLDFSNYESASKIWDMNAPVPTELKAAYDLVIDGGSLEHVFNLPVALTNLMEMVRVGGHLILVSPANNWCGHGFYQFSPELYYRCLAPENGYRGRRMVLCGIDEYSPWYAVADPAEIKKRMVLTNGAPLYLIALAERTAAVPIFRKFPQQSDYVVSWQGEGTVPAAIAIESSLKQKVKSLLLPVEQLVPLFKKATDAIRQYRGRRDLIRRILNDPQHEHLKKINFREAAR